MRIEILVLAALAAFASAAPQWPYRDAVAPYYYGYPGKTPYMYRSAGEEDDEMDETVMARQDLKVGSADGGSKVTVIEDDEKADGIRVVETGSAKPVGQSIGNNQAQDQLQPAQQGNQPLNAQQQQQPNGQPLTVQQPGVAGQQPPAFPPARPQNPARPRPSEDDDDEEDEESDEDDEDAEDEEEGDDDDEDEDEEDDEDRKRNDVQNKDSVEEVVPVKKEKVVPVAVSESTSDEVTQDEQQPQQQPSQSALLNNKVNKNKPVAVAEVEKNKKRPGSKVKTPTGAIEALVPGYVTDQGEVLVPVDTVTGSQPITIVPDPFSPPSRIVGGPRPIPQSAVPNSPSRQVPFWYRNSPADNPLAQEATPLAKQTLYSAVPPPGSIFTFDDDDDDEDAPVPGHRLRQDNDDDGDDDDDDDVDEEDEEQELKPKPKVPLAAVAATGPSGEDDEADALKLVRPSGPRPVKKPAAGAQAAASTDDSEEESEEDDVESEEDEEDDSAARAVSATNKGRMYVDEDHVSFPPSRSPSILAVLQGKIPIYSQSQQEQQRYSTHSGNPFRPDQRYVVRVTPARRPPSPSPSVYYRPGSKVVPVASFDVSVEDTRPDSDEEESVSGPPAGPPGSPFIYKVQGQGPPSRYPGSRPSQRPPIVYYGGAYRPQSYGPPSYQSQSYGPPPYQSQSYGPPPSRRPFPPSPYASFYHRPSSSSYRPQSYSSYPFSVLGQSASLSFGPSRPPSGGPPVIVRRKQSGPNSRPPKPQILAVYNQAGQREPVDEEYYTYEVPETENKIVGPSNAPNKRPTVHRKPTPVIQQKLVSEDEESSEEQHVQIIPQGTVRRRSEKQLKPKKLKPAKKQAASLTNQQQQDPLGILSKVNKPFGTKSKVH